MTKDPKKIFINTILWGGALWLFGYLLGFVFFALVPKEVIGWYILPFGVLFTLWVLLTKIKRDSFTCYIGLGIIWTILAVLLDYLLLVLPLHATDYYKLDVYVYYSLTFLLPIIVGLWQFRHHHKRSS